MKGIVLSTLLPAVIASVSCVRTFDQGASFAYTSDRSRLRQTVIDVQGKDNALVSVELIDGCQFHGTVVRAGQHAFEIRDEESGTITTIQYVDVSQLQARKPPTDIIVLLALVVVVVLVVAYYRVLSDPNYLRGAVRSPESSHDDTIDFRP